MRPRAQRADGRLAQAADGADRDAVAAGAQRLGVEVRERLVLGEVLIADDDPRPGLALRGPAEPVGVDELAADRLGQPAVDHLLVEPAQRERGQQPRRGVQAAAQVGAVALQQVGAGHRHHPVRPDHALVVAQHLDVGARERGIGGERDGDLGDPVVERLDPGVRDRQPHQRRGRRRRAVRASEAGRAVRVRGAVGRCREPDRWFLRVRRGHGSSEAGGDEQEKRQSRPHLDDGR